MTNELLINTTPQETRIALVEQGILKEIHIERESKQGIVGNIYRGKISRVLPGMGAAFVDIGLDKMAFLHISDISLPNEVKDKAQKYNDITQVVVQGQSILVQVIKEPIRTKGARLTTNITLASRYLVFMPNNPFIGISQRIEDEKERTRLFNICEKHLSDLGGFIARTASEGVSEEEIYPDIKFLKNLWQNISKKNNRKGKDQLLYAELNLAWRTIRDFVGVKLDLIKIDSKLMTENLLEFVEQFAPEFAKIIEYYAGEIPIFDIYNIEKEIQLALKRRVDLHSGGYLIIDQTEAMTTIDVNTGAFVGYKNASDTIFYTNLDATEVIARQLRLRNLGGIIIIDFIDMTNDEHKYHVLEHFRKELNKDRIKTTVNSFSRLGLVEMTRKRTKDSLEMILCNECDACGGRGRLKTIETVCYEILREAVRVHKAYNAKKLTIYASNEVANILQTDKYDQIAELEIFINKEVSILAESLYGREQFDVVLM